MSDDDFSNGTAYVQGAFVPVGKASISPLDWAFTRSDAVYDVVHVSDGAFFRLADHLDRFERSMRARRLKPAESREEMERILHRCVAMSRLREAYVAMVTLRGLPRIPGSRRPSDCENHFLAYAIAWVDIVPKDVKQRGVRLWISSIPRVSDRAVDPTVKNYQWSDLTSGLMEAHDHEFDTAVLCDENGFVTEGPGFNVFLVKDGRLSTSDRGSLQGITRRSVLECCKEVGHEASIVPIPRDALEAADEIFLTSTAGGIVPVVRVNQTILGNDRPGPVFEKIQDLYWRKHRESAYRTDVNYAA